MLLFLAAVESVELILRYAQEAHVKGEFLDAKNDDEETALHLAVKNRYVDVVTKLILEGSNLFIK
jgi:ankyrin repeat protein